MHSKRQPACKKLSTDMQNQRSDQPLEASLLLEQTLQTLRKTFYNGKPVKLWKQHEPALRKAVCRFGYEAERRGHSLDLRIVEREIGRVLGRIETSPNYLPAYLESAISGYYKREAERLREHGAARATSALSSVMVRPTEVMNALYLQMHEASKTKRATAKAVREDEKRQGVLL